MSDNDQAATVSNGQQKQAGEQSNTSQGAPLSNEQQNQAQVIEQQIQDLEQQLQQKSNTELSKIATQLETVERAMLLEKIDNQLHSIKNTVVEPGDTPSTTAAGATTAAVIANNS